MKLHVLGAPDRSPAPGLQGRCTQHLLLNLLEDLDLRRFVDAELQGGRAEVRLDMGVEGFEGTLDRTE
eukprot:3562055-Alexandrium_andersonii.AAC.1